VLVYDTYQSKPLAVVRGLHYANLADATWSADGMHLVVCSTDGYISIVSFAPGELGQVYTPPVSAAATNLSTSSIPKPTANKEPAAVTPVLNPVKTVLQQPRQEILLPPCEPGESATIEAPPAKRVKVRITPTLVSASVSDVQPSSSAKRPADDDAEHVGQAVDKLSLNTAGTAAATAADEVKPKKKKRIQPTLLSTVPQQQ
jgi:chromatin assembly factor 1 subunit B